MSAAIGLRAAEAARGWIGTPYLHQASTKGAGTDCLGLLRGVWREILGPEPEPIPPYTQDWSEPAHEERLWAAALRHLRPLPGTAPEGPGEVLLFRMRAGSVAKHVGISGRIVRMPPLDDAEMPGNAAQGGAVPHAPGGPDFGRNGRDPARPGRSGLSRAGTVAAAADAGATFIHAYSGHAVVESPLSAPWRRRIVARFAFPKGDI